MAVEDLPLDDKAKRTRDLLSSFYSADPSSSMGTNPTKPTSLNSINEPSFDPDQYMNILIQKSNLDGILQKHVEMSAEIKNLDTDLQMLVYENYNKFISATDTIKRMNDNIVGMEANMGKLLEKIMFVQSTSDVVNTSLNEKREHIEKLHRTRNLLRKVQFIYDLPTRLQKCIKSEGYADAVRFYTGAMPILKAYGDSSFLDCKRASEEAIHIVTEKLQARLFSESEPIEAKSEATLLLKKLDFPVSSLKEKLFDNLENFLVNLDLESNREVTAIDAEHPAKPDVPPHSSTHQVSMNEFAAAVRAYRVIFPDSEKRLSELARDLITKLSNAILHRMEERVTSEYVLAMLRVIWMDVIVMDEVLPGAALPNFFLEVANGVIKQYISRTFSHLLQDVSEALIIVHSKQNEGTEEGSLQVALDGSRRSVIQGSMDILLEFRQLLDDDLKPLVKLKDLVNDWVQEGFQNFFRSLNDHFLFITGRNIPTCQSQSSVEGKGDKVVAGLVLVVAQLAVFIEQKAIPRITEEVAASFSGGGARGYEHGPAFVPGEICRIFHSAGEKFLNLYINMKTKKISVLLRKRFTTPNWIKHKEPREVHMFVDLLLQELEAMRVEVKQILPRGLIRKHKRSESNGSTTSSRSNPLREDRTGRSNAQGSRSQLLETHLAKLFKEKMEIFTKVEYTQESVVSTVVKLCLKSFQEFVRVQTFNRSGFQQIQLDLQFLRNPLKEIVEDEAAIDFLLDEVTVSTAERCIDPIPLEPAILDKLVHVKLSKSLEQNSTS